VWARPQNGYFMQKEDKKREISHVIPASRNNFTQQERKEAQGKVRAGK